MPMRDSLDKVVGVYFACVCAEPFTYKGHTYHPKPLAVSPLIFRGFTCPAMCGACCPRFSLDYLPHEQRPDYVNKAREVVINGRAFTLYSDMQSDHDNHHCRNLDMVNGRCGVHGSQPFSCDFELIRFLEFKGDNPNMLTQKLFGRKWQMMRFDGDRGTLCEMTPITRDTTKDAGRRLKRLREWCEYFEVPTKLDRIIKWVETGPHVKPLTV